MFTLVHQNMHYSLIVSDMENAAHSSRPDARIIHLTTRENPLPIRPQEPHQPTIMDLYTLEYLDQLLDEHFK